jgi:hypothetical protein
VQSIAYINARGDLTLDEPGTVGNDKERFITHRARLTAMLRQIVSGSIRVEQ